MKLQTTTMGMPATIVIADSFTKENDIEEIFAYFTHIDELFSTYKTTSEISQINTGVLVVKNTSKEVQDVLILCEEAKRQTRGYFDVHRNGKLDPSGMVKGYAIYEAAKKLSKKGYKNFFVEIAGDIEAIGFSKGGQQGWRVGIENPFQPGEIIKVVGLSNCGIATSGNYKQGNHIYNPMTNQLVHEIMSMTVIAKNLQKADMLATATFAMGEKGIEFLEKLKDVEGYMVKKNKTAVMTSGFENLCCDL